MCTPGFRTTSIDDNSIGSTHSWEHSYFAVMATTCCGCSTAAGSMALWRTYSDHYGHPRGL